MSYREHYNQLLRDTVAWYKAEREFLLNATMEDGIPLGFEPMPEKKEYQELNARTEIDWTARMRQVGFAQTSHEFTRMLKLRKKYG
jgi:hypothetical protein